MDVPAKMKTLPNLTQQRLDKLRAVNFVLNAKTTSEQIEDFVWNLRQNMRRLGNAETAGEVRNADAIKAVWEMISSNKNP